LPSSAPSKPRQAKRSSSAESRAIGFLKSEEAIAFLEARDKVQLQRAVDSISADDRRIADTALHAAQAKRFFHWELEFPEVFYGPRPGTTRTIERLEAAGFDAVIGNPPYVRVQELRQSDPDLATFLGFRYQCAVKNFDIYLPFLELGLQITKEQVCYIAPNKWFATDYGEGLRRLVAQRKALSRVVDFRDFQLFPEATNYTCILALGRRPSNHFIYVDASSGVFGKEEVRSHEALGTTGEPLSLASRSETDLLGQVLSLDCPRLKDLRDRAFQGLRTSDNRVYVLHATGPAAKGLLSVSSRATGQVHAIELGILKPLLSGEDIRAFRLTHRDQWIVFPYDVSGPTPTLLSEHQLRSEYPNAWSYLKACESRLRGRERGRMDGPGWWAFGRNQNLDQFEQPKIMLPDYHDHPAAAVDLEAAFYSITAYCLTLRQDAPISLRVLACLLNSQLLFWLLAHLGTALQRGFVRYMPQYLDRLPIVIPNARQAKSMERLTDQGMKQGFDTVQAELEELVCELYRVDPERRLLVESRR
jgi:hypothetical protein